MLTTTMSSRSLGLTAALVVALTSGCSANSSTSNAHAAQSSTTSKASGPWYCRSVGRGMPAGMHGNGHHVAAIYDHMTKGALSATDCATLTVQMNRLIAAIPRGERVAPIGALGVGEIEVEAVVIFIDVAGERVQAHQQADAEDAHGQAGDLHPAEGGPIAHRAGEVLLRHQLVGAGHLWHRLGVVEPGLVAVKAGHHGEQRRAVLHRLYPAGGEAVAVAGALDLEVDRPVQVSRPEEVRVQRVRRAVVGHRARRRRQTLREDLTAKDGTPAQIEALATSLQIKVWL